MAASTHRATATAQSQLSVPQMLCVMRVEFHRARSQRYPITCLMIAVEGLEAGVEAGGYEVKQKLMRATYDCLRGKSRELAFIGMALMSGDRIMAVFPNTPAARMANLAEHLQTEGRKLAARVGIAGPTALSLGAAHSLLQETATFEGFVEAAGRALAMAREGEAGRYVMWREAEAELTELRVELDARRKAFEEQHAAMVEEAADVSGLQQAWVIDEIQRVFSTAERTDEILRLEKEVLALAAKELFEERLKATQAILGEHKRQIDVLERRIAKLTSMLGLTEQELQRVMAMKSIDPGLASLYRTVQGLSYEDQMFETKKAMMSSIFEANVALQKGERS